MPQFPKKIFEPSLVDPNSYRNYLIKRGRWPSMAPPDSVLLVYQQPLYSHICKYHSNHKCDGHFSRLLFLEETNNTLGVMGQFGVGSPAAAIVMEELISYGVKNFISIGTAGSLTDLLDVGDLMICHRALRDEGVSGNYLTEEKFVEMSRPLTLRLIDSFHRENVKFTEGDTWTTDAPYRETRAEVLEFSSQGIFTVEMEAAALAAVAKYHNVDFACALTISDLLSTEVWHPEFHSAKTSVGLETLFQCAKRSLVN